MAATFTRESIYKQFLLRNASPTRRFINKSTETFKLIYVFSCFSAAGGVLFSFGSVLMWAFLKNLLPKNNGVATFVGLTSGFVIVRLTTDYLSEIDTQISEVD